MGELGVLALLPDGREGTYSSVVHCVALTKLLLLLKKKQAPSTRLRRRLRLPMTTAGVSTVEKVQKWLQDQSGEDFAQTSRNRVEERRPRRRIRRIRRRRRQDPNGGSLSILSQTPWPTAHLTTDL